mgnify:CR=1 FL=1
MDIFAAKLAPMNLQERISAFAGLGKKIAKLTENELDELCRRIQNQNQWFTRKQVEAALGAWQQELNEDNIVGWIGPYHLDAVENPKSVGVLMAGNIPAVGFHDLMCVLLSGHRACVKLSSSDQILMQWLIDSLLSLEPRFSSLVSVEEMLKSKDAYIATGSDNSARYFEYYFGKYPHIIRKNRTSVAILEGGESPSDLQALGQDIFLYYGLGCRNVSKLYVRNEDSIRLLLDNLEGYSYVGDNHKYFHNYEYNKSIFLVNREPHLDNGFLLVRESEQLVSPVSVIYFEIFEDQKLLQETLLAQAEKIQCVLSRDSWFPGSLDFGKAQCPGLGDYADGVDTIRFLQSLS